MAYNVCIFWQEFVFLFYHAHTPFTSSSVSWPSPYAGGSPAHTIRPSPQAVMRDAVVGLLWEEGGLPTE
jgi:hypothetical protein